MGIEDLINKDSTFSESAFISKVDNIYIMLLSAIMMNDMEKVKHKLSSELYNKYFDLVDNLNKNNQRQMYDELNVKSTKILSINETDDKYIIEVLLISRYMDYIIDKTTLKYISGINNKRVEKENYLTFEKLKNTKKELSVRKCPGCGVSIDVSSTGKCVYCGSTYDTINYDWILTDIKEKD